MVNFHAGGRLIDLASASPPGALSASHEKGAWQAVPFETVEGERGTLLYAGPETGAPTVRVPLDASGWHRVYLGLWSSWTESRVRVRLTPADAAFSPVLREQNDHFAIDERHWRDADLTGQVLELAQQSAGQAQSGCLAYVRLVSLDGPPSHSTARRKPLVAMNDGFSFFNLRRPTTREEVLEEVQPLLGTDVRHLFWCVGVGGDQPTYPSALHPLIGQGIRDFPRVGDRYAAESVAILRERGIDPLDEALRFAREGGLQFHVSQRMEAFQMCPPFDELFTGQTWQAHPEWRCRDRDGSEIGRLSYAFAGVRDLMLGVFREVLDRYDVDGLNPIFNRGAPFLLYEAPLVETFRERHAIDPRELDERDERWLRFRAATMTGFMRELRVLVDEAGARRGRRLQVSAHVLNSPEESLFYGLDVESWARERLVDRIVSYPWREKPLDVAGYVRIARLTGVEYLPEVMPRFMSPAAYRERAEELYAAGADGLCFWDTDQRLPRLSEWAMLRRLGHVADIEGDGDGEWFRSVPLRSVGGFRLDRYPPHWAF